MASHEPSISEEEMQYYQFKARQMFLLKKEDHEWNQFCKRNTCTCCLCTPVSHEKIKNVGIQTSNTNVQRGISRNLTYIPSKNRSLPNSLIEIKEKLDKLDLSLAKVITFQEKEISDLRVPSKLVSAKSSASDKNALKDDRLDIIHNVLKGSLQRLQSASTWKESSSAHSQKKGSGFMLPRDLQDQRIVAQRAYLASLARLKNKSETTGVTNSSSKMTNLSKRPQKLIPKKPVSVFSNLHKDKTNQKKLRSVPQKRKESTESNLITAVQSNEMKDENIENAIDVMIDDLIGETALSINKIKYMKTLKKLGNQQTKEKNRSQLTCIKGKLSDERVSHPSHWEKIRKNLSHLKSKIDIGTEDTAGTKTSCEPEFGTKEAEEQPTLLQTTKAPTTVSFSTSLEKTNIYINTKSVKEISKQRKEFWKYLESISRTQKGNFNPWTLSNMVAESLLDDCILDVSKELQDIPSDMIMGLYNQEFLSSLTDN